MNQEGMARRDKCSLCGNHGDEKARPFLCLSCLDKATSIMVDEGWRPKPKSLSPEDTQMTDFIGIGFRGGVETCTKAVNQLLGLELEIDYEPLRETWAEAVAEEGRILDFNRHYDGAFRISHAWAFRWIVYSILDHMDTIGAKNFVRQEITMDPSIMSGIPGIMIEVSRLDWWRKQQKEKGA